MPKGVTSYVRKHLLGRHWLPLAQHCQDSVYRAPLERGAALGCCTLRLALQVSAAIRGSVLCTCCSAIHSFCLGGLRCYGASSEPGGVPSTFPFFQISLSCSALPVYCIFLACLLKCSDVMVRHWGRAQSSAHPPSLLPGAQNGLQNGPDGCMPVQPWARCAQEETGL